MENESSLDFVVVVLRALALLSAQLAHDRSKRGVFAFVWMGLFIHGSAAPTAIARELVKKIRSFSTPTFEQPRARA